jgi:hypothetical protein
MKLKEIENKMKAEVVQLGKVEVKGIERKLKVEVV